MSRSSVLLVESNAALRKQISTGLARFGYEVVPAVSTEEGVRFAETLAPVVMVADADAPGFADGTVFERLPGLRQGRNGVLVLLGRREEDEARLPRAVRYLQVDGLGPEQVLDHLRLVLLGQEVGIETDPDMRSLIGDLEETPPLELVRALHRARFTGQVEMPAGEVRLQDGEVVAATAGPLGSTYRPVGGVKAFCRLGRLRQGTFHVQPADEVPAAAGGEAIGRKMAELVIAAVEDASKGQLPHPRSSLQVELGPDFFSATYTASQQRILELAQKGMLLGGVLDSIAETDGAVLADVRHLEEAAVLRLQEPEARLYVVTDSSSDLPADLARANGIHVVPLTVTFGEDVYADGVDLRPRQFYQMLEERDEHPVTAPPRVSDFQPRYQELLERRDVVSLHLSEKMSQTVVHARQAAADAGEAAPPRGSGQTPQVDVVDTRVVSLGLGMLALYAARMASRDLTAAEVARRIDEMKGRMGILFVVDTLEYLRRGGRIGAARAWFGKLLGIKPILGVSDGEVVPVDRVRGGRAAHPRILELMAEEIDPDRPLLAGVAHARAPVWADRLGKLIAGRFQVAEMIGAEMGPTVGAHAGPGTVGVGWLQPTDEELELLAPAKD